MKIITGSSIKTDGSIRQWDCVEYIKEQFRKHLFYYVMENGEEKQINMDTFTGQVIDDYKIVHYKNGTWYKEWYRSPHIGKRCLACNTILTEDNALKSTQMCNTHKCVNCGDTITDKNVSFSVMACNKPDCERYVESMDW